MTRTIGKVKSISGKAAVKTTNDQLHVLKVGEELHENEMVYALGADSKVTLTLEGGRELTLNGYDEILLDKSVFTALEEGEALDVKALQQALAEALTPENMEETAAGNEVVSDANAGAEYALRNDARGNPGSYLTGTDSSSLGVTFESLQNENFAPEAFDDSAVAVEEGKGNEGQYDAPIIASGNVLDNDTDDLLPNPPADLDVSAVTSNNTANTAVLANGFFTIVGLYGTLVINAETGEYTYTVNENNPDVDGMNVGDSVSESFTYTVSDGSLSDQGILTLTINGSNDAPVAVADHDYIKEAGYHVHSSIAEGNVIVDSDSDVDNENIWVVGVQKTSGGSGHGGEGEESHEGGSQGHEGEQGHEGYGPGGPHAPTGYDFSITGKYGTLFMWENGDYVYMLKNGKEQVDSLNEGDRVSETFTYTITDGNKFATATLTIHIEGTNDAPIANPDQVQISEDWFNVLSINALQNDTDVDSGDDASNFNLVSVYVEGGFVNGIAWIDPHTNTIKYIPNWLGNQSMNEGDIKTVTLNYTMSDDSGATSTSTVTVTITGENDRAYISGDDDGSVKEDWHVSSSGMLRESGTLHVSDVDEGEAKFSTAVIADPHNIGGSLTIDQYGNWNYSINNNLVQYLGNGDKAYEYFTVHSIDGTDSEMIRITITGTNDIARITGDDEGWVKEDWEVSESGTLRESGILYVSDVDQGEAKFSTHVISNPGNLGTLSINQNGQWNYSVNNALVQYLGTGDTKTETFTVKSIDGTDSQTITVIIIGTNDGAVITGDKYGNVTEDLNISSGKLHESGRLYVSDADQGEAKFSTTVIADSHNIGGILTIDQYGNWNYSINNSLVQYLSVGEKMYEYFTVKSLDGSDSEIIKITITGTNDAPIANADSSSTDVVTHTTTVYYNLNAGNEYTSSGVTITPINGTSVDRSGPTMGVVGPDSSSQMINPEQSHMEKVGKHEWIKVVDAEEEGIRFVFDQNIKNAVIDFGNFGDHDTASWAIYNAANQKIAFGTYTNNGNPNDSILNISSNQEFNRIEIINSDNDDSFTIDQVIATGSSVSSITSGSLIYFTEADLLSNDSDIDHLDTLSIAGVSSTSARGAIISIDDDGNILYNPNDALDTINQMTYDTFSYTISDGHGGMSTGVVTVALTPSTTTEAYDGQTLLIESSNGHEIDFSNIAALSSNFSQIDLKNGDVSLINVSPENVDNASENGTLVINGEAADSITLSGSWSGPATADGYTTYTATVDSSVITLHIETEIIP